jgi:hypothetical protein
MAKILTFVIVFLVIGAVFIVVNLGLNITNKNDQSVFLGEYGKWIKQSFINAKNVVGYAVKMEWIPKEDPNQKINKTNSTRIYKN